jgi:hypothetical protein
MFVIIIIVLLFRKRLLLLERNPSSDPNSETGNGARQGKGRSVPLRADERSIPCPGGR